MDAFQAGAGIEGSELSWFIAGVGCSAILLVAGWILLSAYRGYVKGRVEGDIIATVSWRALLLILLFLWLFL
ncbi:TIGR03758 family integrating conjugative element protein [Halomonas sp. McH1-25]|uniref:TIGR03758 family integrating conjugative element protein n=1 Tax=unclassified Halomonas TaxID=2609666 RepID=UPI001EF569DF|nr:MULTISPECIES: TIGR03758 family integrating conjugative element protein [unclassified Halomonas]MCG7601779.1 TIGR03758 family integrating conjugative element protein [Halomonas sp. McH1-25]MCP1343955.1 TIGR03758 family integrating conjugative element protein [Halomonas sp. FL8]MCP1361812.1 TIGR03758 family integrating conjugative element protein [Halomonas sp. BBD45]MCP1366571.1 TIGR03758 family integrating conjugative element protein [Halomonas sp. BBD48]